MSDDDEIKAEQQNGLQNPFLVLQTATFLDVCRPNWTQSEAKEKKKTSDFFPPQASVKRNTNSNREKTFLRY